MTASTRSSRSRIARFPDDLAFSLDLDARAAFDLDARAAFDRAYRQAFGDDFRLLRTDALGLAPSDRLRWQKMGIDVALAFPDGRVLTADEKLRRADWSDFLLEEFSDFHRLIPGWLTPDKRMDLIAYARPIGINTGPPFTPPRAQPRAQPFQKPGSKDGLGSDRAGSFASGPGLLGNEGNDRGDEERLRDEDLRAEVGLPDGACRWRVTLLWARPLRAKAAREWHRWLRDYGRKLSDNPSYITSSLPLPWHELHDCLVRSEMRQASVFPSSPDALSYDCLVPPPESSEIPMLPPTSPSPLLLASDFLRSAGDPPPPLVEGLLPDRSLLLLAAKPKFAKSFLALDLGLAVSVGAPVFGAFTVHRPGPVAYYSLEDGEHELSRRLRLHGLSESDPRRFYCSTAPLDLSTADGVDRWAEELSAIDPVLVLVDTAAEALGVRDWNQRTEIHEKLGRLRTLSRSLCSILLVVHSRKQKGKGGDEIAGSNALTAAVDGWISLQEKVELPNGHLRLYGSKEGRGGLKGRLFVEMDRETLEFRSVTSDASEDDPKPRTPTDGWRDRADGWKARYAGIAQALVQRGQPTSVAELSAAENPIERKSLLAWGNRRRSRS